MPMPAPSLASEVEVSAEVELDSPIHLKPIIEGGDDKNLSNVVASKPSKNGFEVMATKNGFYNQHRIKENDVFFIKKWEDLGVWMKVIDPDLEKKHQAEIKEKKEQAKK